MRLEQSLVVNRYFHSLFGAQRLEDLRLVLSRMEEGPGGDGQSHFSHALAGMTGVQLPEGQLREYDGRIMSYEVRLAKARGSFVFKYFQYLCLLYTEIFLDRLTEDPKGLIRELNTFLGRIKKEEISLQEFSAFTMDDLRRLAFFMATGSGKTLLLHVNLWQVLHYLELGKHPEALVSRADRRREFDTILLVTPNEGLSQQHLREFGLSGIDATLLVVGRAAERTLAPQVKVIEIHKLAEEPSKEGVSILLEELGGANLVFVDEGHKGTGSEAQTWKNRQKRLSSEGFLMEYSATFAQAIGAATPKARDALLTEYGKSILFDYSYRHFYDDGYGKDFRVLNLARAKEAQANDLLLGGLLTYYQQVRLFRENGTRYRAYNLERPLWVFLGSRVSKRKWHERDPSKTAEQERSDVAVVVAFLRRFLEDPDWAEKGIRRILKGESGFTDQDSGQDLFARHLTYLNGMEARQLYMQIAKEVFHGRGGLELFELKGAEGELALRVSSPEGKENPYFGVINIGDVSAFRKHLQENLGIEVREDRFMSSLFGEVNAPASRINVLIGAKKFIEGWSSWRVSTMGLLNVGKGEGPQVIQLFGRGVRLKGKKWSLKRSAKLPEEAPHPEGVSQLETLFIFGWNADYVQAFRGMLEQEDLGRELRVQVQISFDPWPTLPIPRPQEGYDPRSETWTLAAGLLQVSVDSTPQVTVMNGAVVGEGEVGKRKGVDFMELANRDLLDRDALFADLVEYKAARGYGNVYVPFGEVLPILQENNLLMLEDDMHDPRLVQEGALKVLKTYLDRFVARKEREAESRHIEPSRLPAVHESVVRYYTVRVTSDALLKEIEELLSKPTELYRDGGRPLPRLHVDRHLFRPLLLQAKGDWAKDISISPPGLGEGEARLVEDLRDFWRKNHAAQPYANLEIFLLRNLPRVGVGFFRRSGFYPDFILWIKDKATKVKHVQFLEPHGMHHGGLSGNEDKIEALKELRKLSSGPPFQSKKITMAGFLLTDTKLEQIPDARGKTWESLERDYRVLLQEGNYIAKILKTG